MWRNWHARILAFPPRGFHTVLSKTQRPECGLLTLLGRRATLIKRVSDELNSGLKMSCGLLPLLHSVLSMGGTHNNLLKCILGYCGWMLFDCVFLITVPLENGNVYLTLDWKASTFLFSSSFFSFIFILIWNPFLTLLSPWKTEETFRC